MFIKPKRKVDKIFLHCSASDYGNHDDISMIRGWHLKRGFKSVGYHYFIKKTGQLQFGRSLEVIPASQKGHNRRSIAICVSGLSDFTQNSLNTVKTLCKEINKEYEGDITFHGHCEVSNKTCPVFDYIALLNLNEEGKIMKLNKKIINRSKDTAENREKNKKLFKYSSIIITIFATFKALYKVSKFFTYVLPNHPKIRVILNIITIIAIAYIGYRCYDFIVNYLSLTK